MRLAWLQEGKVSASMVRVRISLAMRAPSFIACRWAPLFANRFSTSSSFHSVMVYRLVQSPRFLKVKQSVAFSCLIIFKALLDNKKKLDDPFNSKLVMVTFMVILHFIRGFFFIEMEGLKD